MPRELAPPTMEHAEAIPRARESAELAQPSAETVKKRARSVLTSGRKMLIGGNANGVWARRFRDLQSLHLSDLGGSAAVSEGEHSLVRRIAVLTIELERLESKLSRIDDPSPEMLDLYQRLTNSLRRVLETLSKGLGAAPAT